MWYSGIQTKTTVPVPAFVQLKTSPPAKGRLTFCRVSINFEAILAPCSSELEGNICREIPIFICKRPWFPVAFPCTGGQIWLLDSRFSLRSVLLVDDSDPRYLLDIWGLSPSVPGNLVNYPLVMTNIAMV